MTWDDVMGQTGSYLYLSEMVDAKPEEPFADVYDRLGEMMCVCAQMTEDLTHDGDGESRVAGEEMSGSGGFNFK
jgi:hypothetical protein